MDMGGTAAPAPKSGGRGCLKAMGIGCLVVAIGLSVLAYAGYRVGKRIMKEYTAVMERFEREGYHKVEGQMLDIRERVSEPTIFVGQIVRIHAGSERGIAIVAQQAEIEGEVVGNVYFMGQMLTVKPGAHLMRDLDVKGQMINNFGTVDGKITGAYQSLNSSPPAGPAAPPASP